MGLDAKVHCNCIKEGKAVPHPFPDLFAFDETGEPILKSESEIPLDQWLVHDKWLYDSCPHSGELITRRLGNGPAVKYFRDFIEANSAADFPILLERVVHSGTHAGDWMPASESPQLLIEASKLDNLTSDPIIHEFATSLIELAEASIATGNPIVF